MTRFAGRVVVVTGGATGIGAACARAFAAEGGRVTILDVNDEAEALAREIGGRFRHVDVSSEPEVRRAVAEVVGEHGRLDVM
ncbi:MAG: SDR family oxidoreductase, partial [Thermoleophilia bacterium]|nr:SDR family oxidoreductase [Thermoleophilia bacterium]